MTHEISIPCKGNTGGDHVTDSAMSKLGGSASDHPSRNLRQPTSNAEALRWYWQALNDKALHLDLEIDYHVPQCGWFLTRMAKQGPMVPARIFLEQEVCPDTGELLSDEILRCQVNGQERDPLETWIWLASEPIEEGAFNYLMARKGFAEAHAPEEPAANAYSRTDWAKVPTPTFTKEQAQ